MYGRRVLLSILLQSIATSLCYERRVYYVKPSADGQCPDDPCYTLGGYLSISGFFSQSNTTFYFLQGIHAVDRAGMENIIAVTHLSLVGMYWQSPSNNGSSSRLPVIIKCNTDFGLLFQNTASILVTNITIIHCGTELTHSPVFKAALSFLNSADIELVGIKIQSSRGYGLYILNAQGISKIVQSELSSNGGGELYDGGNVYLEYHFTHHYCGIKPVHFNIVASEFSKGDSPLLYSHVSPGFYIKIQHYCVDINISFENTTMFLNNRKTTGNVRGGNLGIIITELTNTSGQHHISIANSRIKNGIARRGGGVSFQVYGETVYSECRANKNSTSIVNSLTISNTLITGNVASQQAGGYYGVIRNLCQKYSVTLTSVNFTDNRALIISVLSDHINGGNMVLDIGLIISGSVHSITIENSIFQLGVSEMCGGLFIILWYNTIDDSGSYQESTNDVFLLNNTFIGNEALVLGGLAVQTHFIYTPEWIFSQVVIPSIHGSIRIQDCRFTDNKGLSGSSISITSFEVGHLYFPTLSRVHYIIANVTVYEDRVVDSFKREGAVVSIYSVRNITFLNCTFKNNNALSLRAKNSNVYFGGTMNFINNSGLNGGALALLNSFILPKSKTVMHFYNNHAVKRGGAIYIQDEGIYFKHTPCFLQVLPEVYTTEISTMAYFENNTAGEAGSVLYGSNLDSCTSIYNPDIRTYHTVISVHDSLLDYTAQTGPSVIASDPIGVCLCNNGEPECRNKSLYIEAFPGDSFVISAVIVGQRNGTVPGVIHAMFQDADYRLHSLDYLQYSQATNNICTNLTYTVFSRHEKELVQLSVEKVDKVYDSVFTPPQLDVHLLPCPLGFNYSGVPVMCGCSAILAEKGYICDIHKQTVHRPKNVWIGCSNHQQDSNYECGVLLHSHCPLDYCKEEDSELNLEHPDTQCALNHSGILCGKCQSEFSLALGTSQCFKCSSAYLLLIVVFSVAGLVLVFLLSSCNLVISEGTLNSLIFYVNIIQVSRPALLQRSDKNALTMFVAWLNLDFGIETCFYNGMDMYAKAWLQFTFPIYIWVIVAGMIVLSYYYTTAAKLVGKNAPKVLATLFLLSYAKLLRAVITILSFTYLDYPDRHSKLVWLFDGNVDYLRGKHIPLFIAAIVVLITVLIPYTLVVFFMQCLRRKSGYKMQAWVRRLKPVMDPYGGPYKDKYQFWTGLLLVVRVLLFLAFAFNSSGNPALNLLLVAISATALLCLQLAFFSGVYKRKILDILEALFLVNLGIVASATLFVQLVNGNLNIPTFISITISLTIFTLILLYHLYKHTSIKIWITKIKVHNRGADNVSMQVFNSPGNSEIEYRQVQQQIQPPQHEACAHRLTIGEDGELMLLTDN